MNYRARIYQKYSRDILPKIKHLRGANRLDNLLQSFSEVGLPKVSENPKSIFSEDWDNLIILDACRHDIYESLMGGTKSRISKDSSSSGFIRENFSDGVYEDIIYISANPHLDPKIFESITDRDIDDVFFDVYHTYRNSWNKQKGTVLPKEVIKDALLAEKLFPEKRKIIHFMQPHHPMIPDQQGEGFTKNLKGENKDSIWELAEADKISDEEVWNSYKRNLEYVMGEIEVFLNEIEGRTIITSDHGNFVGENGIYDHPEGSNSLPVRKVPWDRVKE